MAGIGDDFEFQSPANQSSSPDGGGSSFPRVALIAAIVAILLGAAVGYFVFQSRRAPASQASPKPAAAPAPAAAADQIEHIDLPALDDSDALVRQRIGILSSNPLVTAWLGT